MTHPASDPSVVIVGLDWPEIRAGDDLAALLVGRLELSDGDVVVVTSKVVSKAEGRHVPGDRGDAVAAEAVRVLARRGDSVIAETSHGLVMAAAGVDASNTEPGTALLLPVDPDASARSLREAVHARTGANIGVVISDTAGRAWRNGQIDIAIGCAGLNALNDLSGTTDPYGNVLVVTAPGIADEIASAADLVKGKSSGRPVAVLRGLQALVLPLGHHGPGAAELVRPSELDLFGLGAREAAVAAALRSDPVALGHFPPRFPVDPAPFEAVSSDDPDVRIRVTGSEDTAGWLVQIDVRDDAAATASMHAGRLWERCAVLAAAHLLSLDDEDDDLSGGVETDHGWHTVVRAQWIIA